MVIVLASVFFVSTRSKKESGGNWVQFFSKGREMGFTFKEVEMLRHYAVQCNLESPNHLFESQSHLDKCIRFIVRSIKMSGESDERGTQVFLSKLYDYRQKIEINKPQSDNKIINSRQISEGQMLKVLVEGVGVFKSQVVRNSSQAMTITRPVNSKITSSILWMRSKISVYFWRADDAGYVFDSEVIDEVYSTGIPSIKITHGESLFRTQKRKSVRAKMHKVAFLYLVSASEPPHKIEADPGLKCFLEDISDTGYAITVGGKADSNVRVKVQFALDNAAICITGTVRSTVYNADINRSILHIEAETLPTETRNHILSEVFGMAADEDEEELPFRVLDEEMSNIAADSAVSSPESNGDAIFNTVEDIDQQVNG